MTYEFHCDKYDCPFMIRTTDDEEILEHVTRHASTAHGIAIDRGVVEDALEVV
ncbi:DUF1059 domain-containing protein [Haloarchaeobius sp. TZWWS8]|uniref:DUF1059 domain-containing protein n=1 Tax=Haloarchaeobius sp. TZWWS8 TaxID=3446121 RepID=UPI003EB8283A